MAIEASSAISAADVPELRDAPGLRGAESPNFADWLGQELATVSDQIRTAELQVRQLAAGEHDNLHQVMLSLEKAKLGFELIAEVRNKLLEGYQEIMRMQV
jgi:flagellar hook-basal body complex protein FliE